MEIEDFKCEPCQECCKQPGDVYLRSEEAEAIAQFLQLDLYAFTNQFCDMPVKPRLILKKKEPDHCLFLNEKGCEIYPARPQQCRDFPHKWHTENSLQYCKKLNPLKKPSF